MAGILPMLAEKGFSHWLSRGERKRQAGLEASEMTLRKSQEKRLQQAQTTLDKQIDATITKWNDENQGRITAEDNGMMKAIMIHATEASKRGDFNAANSWMKVLRDNYPQLKGVGNVVYEPGETEGEWKVTSIGDGKAIKYNPMGDVEVIDLSEENTPVAKTFKDKIDLINATRAEIKRIDDKWQTDMYESVTQAASQNVQEALFDAERKRKLQELFDDLTLEMYGGGSPMPTIDMPKTQMVETPQATPEVTPVATPTPITSVSMEIPRASLPEMLQDKPAGTRAILKDGRVLEITEQGGRFLSEEEAATWKAQRSE